MPELPEVETIRRGLIKHLKNKKIIDFENRDKKIVSFNKKEIIGLQIKDVKRCAKILLFHLSQSRVILIHPKMTGQLVWERSSGSRVSGGHPNNEMVGKLPTKSTRAIFNFDDGSILFFNDQRRFAYLRIYDEKKLANGEIKELSDIGLDPFSDKFTTEYLMKFAKRFPKRKIKQFLMDQRIIAGIGNIYSNEGLFYAGIMPNREATNIKKGEWSKIRRGVIKALELGLKYGGTSDNTYVNAEGNIGYAQDHLMVYRREGEACKKCRTKIKRMVIGGRGTYFCPKCQN